MMQVKDVMTSRPHYLGEDATIREVAEAMRANQSGFEPLTNARKVVAVVTDRDLVVEGLAADVAIDDAAKSIASSDVLYTYANSSVEDALTDMTIQQVQRLLVLDNPDDKQLVGVITIGDIAEHCAVEHEDAEAITDKLISAVRHYH